MKNFDLKACGVSEISLKEMEETNGGWIIAAITIIGAIIYVIDNWDDFVDGLKEGYEAYGKK